MTDQEEAERVAGQETLFKLLRELDFQVVLDPVSSIVRWGAEP